MSSDKSEEDEQDVISKQIIDYYKKYSQNKDLPKYFSGTSLSYMPPIVKGDEFVSKSEPVIILDETNTETLVQRESVPLIQIEEAADPKPLSPTSSITSNRKLEWDNGADIGYNNCDKNLKLHKSVSLPILLDFPDVKNIEKKVTTKLCTEIVTVVSYCGDVRGDDKQIQSSSSSPSYPAEVPIESTSSSIKTNPKPLSSSSSSFTSTLAYLKNKIGSPDAESTPKIFPGVPVYTETPFLPKKKEEKRKNKIINLCMTKPVLIQCLDNQKKGFDKKIQTTVIENISKCVQTTDSLETLPQTSKSPIPNAIENQSVIFVNYDSESDKRTCSSNTQTDGELIASQCDSFEYYRDEYKEPEGNGTLKRSSSKSNLAASTDSSKDLPVLGQLISSKQSKTVIGDVDRSIELLQKLLKSKKYDPATKKRYIKKIVEKIVDTKYNEDSTSSSELFIPKKHQLQENVPWHPQFSKFTVKTFSDEFLPSEEGKKSLEVNQSEDKSSLDTNSTGTSLEKQQNTSSGSYQSWKEDKTLSERLLEEKQRGQGDHLVKYALKEREHQIDWIKDEISHLTKLKGLLEEKVQRTTTVYMVSQKHDHSNANLCKCSCKKNPPRSYVIQTELSTSSSEVPTDYNLYDKRGKRVYRVIDATSASNSLKVNPKVVGNIEVSSDDKTTNIKVQSKKVDKTKAGEFKPKSPLLVGRGKYDTFPRSKTEERCSPSGSLKSPERLVPCERLNSLGQLDLNGESKKRISFEVPLDSRSSITKKVTDFVTKINAGLPTAHKCKCLDVLDNKIKVITPLQPIKTQSEMDPNEVCHCCGRPAKSETYTAECQTDDCRCCNKQVQTSIPKRDTSVETSSAHSKDESTKTNSGLLKDELVQIDSGSSKGEHVKRDSGASKDEYVRRGSGCSKDECVKRDSVASKDEFAKRDSERLKSISESSESSTSYETASATSESVRSCMCCKQKNVTSKRLYALRKKLSDQACVLCRPCYRQNRRGVYSPNYFANPGHRCNCYTVVQTTTLNEIKETINNLNELERYCTCFNLDNRNGSNCCKYCKCKLKKTSKSKNGIAYMLTFEDGPSKKEEKKKKRNKKHYLEEIRIKIPVSYKKKHKDKENKKRKEKHSDSDESSSSDDSKKKTYDVKEYLNQNRPDFVQVAEGRRSTVNKARKHREESSDYNKLMFLKQCQEECEKNSKRLFSAKEMKEITERNYKKLPEVQKKLKDHKDKQLKQASRLMADTFNK